MAPKASSMEVKSHDTVVRLSAVAASTVALLRNLIDYAGLFPPASLAMTSAVANYDQYSRSEFSWILGRFILPAVRLGEFETAYAQLPALPQRSRAPWQLSVLMGNDGSADLARIREFNSRSTDRGSPIRAEIASVETRIASIEDIERFSKIIPAALEAYFEIPLSLGATADSLRDSVAAVAACGRRAKIRTGGETADRFPSPEDLLGFLELCASANVPFKATAGLHHPLRSRHRLTYQFDSPTGIMHGFLNVFLAAAFVRAGLATTLALDLLEEHAADRFQFDSASVTWRGHRLSVHDLAASRERFSISFGSCSLTEPIDDLRSLHLL